MTSTKGSLMRLRILPKPVLFAATLGLIVAGCGVRGDLELPPSTTPDTVQGETTPQETAPQDDRSFILDGLLL